MYDFDTMVEQVQDIIRYSQEYPDSVPLDGIEFIINLWRNNKEYYIKELFKGETRICLAENVSINLTPSDQKEYYYSLLDDYQDMGILNADLETFLRLNYRGIFNNKVVYDSVNYPIKSGMKLSKCLKYYIEEKNTLRKAQDRLSECTQANTLHGNIYLSVDPRDFLSASENNHNWRSCQALDGDFRNGNFSYLLDNVTLMIYFASAEDVKLRAFPNTVPWNNKIWRMYIHTNNFKECIYFNRQYPFKNKTLFNTAFQGLIDKGIIPDTFTEPEDRGAKVIILPNGVSLRRSYNLIRGYGEFIYDSRDFIDNCGNAFCDLISSSDYTPIVSVDSNSIYYQKIHKYLYSPQNREKVHKCHHAIFDITIGDSVPCVVCGCDNNGSAEHFMCENCIANYDADTDFFLECGKCGRRIYDPEKDGVLLEDEWYCRGCYYNLSQEEDEEDEER